MLSVSSRNTWNPDVTATGSSLPKQGIFFVDSRSDPPGIIIIIIVYARYCSVNCRTICSYFEMSALQN